MSIQAKDQIYRESLFQSFLGLDTHSSLTNMDPRALSIADNTDIDAEGYLNKRKGYTNTLTVSVWTGRTIRGGIEYQKDSSTRELVVFGHQNAAGTGELGISTTSVSSIVAGLSNNRPSLNQFGALLFYYNGSACFLYDGTTTRQIGITAPTNAPTDNANIAGSLVVGASYIYSYTYYNSVTGAESSPSPLFTIVMGAGGGRRINITAGSATTADTIRVYRTTANGAILFLDGTTGIASTTYDSTVADAGLGAELELDNTRITTWGEPPYAAIAQNRFFVTGISSIPNRVHFSKIGKEGPMPESFQAVGFADCSSSGGLKDINVGIGQANDTPIVLKKFSAGRLTQIGSVGSEVGVDTVIFEYQEISRAVNAVSHWAQCSVYGNLVFLGRDNVYMTDGNSVTPIATKISDDIKGFSFSSPEKLSGHNDIKNKRVMFSVMSTTSATEADYVLVGHYHNFPEFYWTLYKPGTNTSTHPGISAGSFFDVLQSNGSTEVYFGNNKLNGKLYKMNTGDNDDSLGIDWRVRDYPTHYGLHEENKLFFKDIIHALGNGNNYNMNCYSVYDLSDVPQDPYSLSLFQNLAQWDSATWDVAVWPIITPVRQFYSKHRKAVYCQLQMENSNADEPVTIYGYIKNARPENFK